MPVHESLREFNQRHQVNEAGEGPFYIHRIEEFPQSITLPHQRRDFYKITLADQSKGILSYADRMILVNDNVLAFSNPMIPYSFEKHDGAETGYCCFFSEAFIHNRMKGDSLARSPLFKVSGNHVLFPAPPAMNFLRTIFAQMMTEMTSEYPNKYDLIHNYVQIILHEALKIEPPSQHYQPNLNTTRIADLFLELLQRQFPVDARMDTLRLRNANEFAHQLALHPNHLTRVLKEATGKTTSEHITETIAQEAKRLLTQTNWEIAEAAYALRFEHVPSFNYFFKKQVGQAPGYFRQHVVAYS